MVPRGTIEFISRLLWIDDGKVLVCRNIKHGHCYLPGGHVEFGETATDAVCRELKEEANIKIDVEERPVAIYEMRFQQRGRDRHEIVVVFRLRGSASTPNQVVSVEDGIAFEWIPVEQLKSSGFVPECQLSLFQKQAESSAWCSV